MVQMVIQEQVYQEGRSCDLLLSTKLSRIHLFPRLFPLIQVPVSSIATNNKPRLANHRISDIIPRPMIGLPSSVSLFSEPAERDAARQGLESLNREATDPNNTSQRLQQTFEDLKALLRPENVAQ